MAMDLSSGEIGTKTEARFKPKKGSVFPKKKRSVKRMMFNYLVHRVGSVCSPCFFSFRHGAGSHQESKVLCCGMITKPTKVSNADWV
ncbi:hypothetical protein OIU85_018124 [Salix viminalis]|uniref:Uncharacterized protein n=1 Tax=Salix viminalis TaxID=40686 RepID=A0A6N2LSW4_SALVM|nr:hypothetical protein OIU85_018124 [Salix viminalis]